MEYLQLACPYCAGQFSAAAGLESRTTACPHCDREVTVPALPPSPLPRATSPTAPPTPPKTAPPTSAPPSPSDPLAETAPSRRLSSQERARLRRRVNFVLAVLGMAILAAALLVLVRLRP